MLTRFAKPVRNLRARLSGRAAAAAARPVGKADETIRIMLAVLTTSARGSSLRECARAIALLRPVPGVRLEFVIVQNGAALVSEEVASIRTENSAVNDVILEPQKGIPRARNRALDHAAGAGADYLAFIDDDAVPDQDWLVEAVRVLRETGADAVTGPQHPVFPKDAPVRLSRAAIYKAVDHDPELACSWAASNNVIFSVSLARAAGLRFDESFTTGGSDKEFFLRFSRAGGRIRWAPLAIVREDVVPDRLTLSWAIRRSWRLGATGFRIERSGRSAPEALAICLAKGGIYVAAGLLLLPTLLVPRHAGCIDGLCYITHGTGFILGVSPVFRPRSYS